MKAVLCEGLVQIYRSVLSEVVALRGVDLAVDEGETVALLGPSGAGKSTLLWLLAGLVRPSAGKIWLHGHEISQLTASELDRLRREHTGMLLQTPSRNLIPTADAVQNVAFAQRAGKGSRREKRRRLGELLESLGLAEVAGQQAGGLSGGEQQRLALAVALANRPRLVLADEPTSQLDPDSAREVIRLLAQAATGFGATVVVVTHDPAVSDQFDRAVTIRDGRVGSEARRGEDLVVIGPDGSVQLPPEMHDLLPPGGLARIARTQDGARLLRVAEGDLEP